MTFQKVRRAATVCGQEVAEISVLLKGSSARNALSSSAESWV